jgi:hypothetical protein
MLPSSFHFDEASRFDATGRLHFVSRDQRATTVHFHGSTTLQPKRSNGVVSRVTIRWPRERTMAAMSKTPI